VAAQQGLPKMIRGQVVVDRKATSVGVEQTGVHAVLELNIMLLEYVVSPV
jgi:hypothetical protein